jgi:hypothetical protein
MSKTLTVTKPKNVTLVTKPLSETVTTQETLKDLVEFHDPGAAGPPNVLSIGTVTVATQASASITGIAPNQVLNLVYPAATRHVHTQGTVATTWTINHLLGGYPSVMVVDSAKTVVYGEINYTNTSQVVVNFSSAFSGYAYLT